LTNHSVVRQIGALTALATAAALALSGCSGGGAADQTIESAAPDHLSGTVSLWHFFTDREAGVIQSVVDDFQTANPDVKVKVHSGQDDEKLRKSIASGDNVDVGLSYSTDIVGSFCDSGAFRDLGPYIERDKVDLGQFSDTVRSYTEYDGTRCALPVLADTYGIYYNKDLLSAAGFSAPPKTLDELETMAMKLTTFNADGSIKTLGFNPMMNWYENQASQYSALSGASWLKDDGTSNVGSDPAWAEVMTWQKAFVDTIGYDKLNTFSSGLGQEFSADNALQSGQVAMTIDGEWRTAFIADQTPDLNYGTAPFPTSDPAIFGGGYITGNIAGIAKGSQHPELAWALLKYLATDTEAIVKLSNGLKNVPTTKDALASPDLEVSEQFKTFLDIAASGLTRTTPPNVLGAAYQQALGDYWDKYQAGNGGDLTAGLKGVDKSIDDALSLATGP
jgi:multiple sugar transport system substrate-binding protein